MMMSYKDLIFSLKEHGILISCDDLDISFNYLSYNSNDVKDGTLFVCKGNNFKRDYLVSALENGACCYVSEEDFGVSIPCILVNDVRKALAICSSIMYPDNLIKIGITGTKGKTTTNYFLHNILCNHLGYKPGIFATHYYYSGKSEGESHLTTPESLELHKYLNEMSEMGLKYVSMEVSSQAEFHDRVYGMNFDIGAFLNISPDHISLLEHKDFEDYFSCKLNFLKKCKKVVVYKHTDHYDDVINSCSSYVTFGFKDSDYVIKNISNDGRISFELCSSSGSEVYEINMAGRFNVINASAAIVIAKEFGVSYDNICKGLLETTISGRMNVVFGRCPIIIDYAHNELSARALYESLKDDYPGKRIKVVFGCPGDKGFNRRRDMGLLAGEYADYVYLTSEDPGHSKVSDICDDIIKYIKKYHSNYEVIEDRESAIRKAILESSSDDVLAILGKGDENYQMVDGKWVNYDTDIVIVNRELAKIKE